MSQSTESGAGLLGDLPSGKRFYSWLALIGLGLLIGLYGAIRLLLEGTVLLGIETQLPWGILISTYVFFVLLSTGICIGVTSMASVFGVKKYEPLVKRGIFLSIITLVAGGMVIMVSLGRPERPLIQMILSPNPGAPMWWMIVLYGIYGGALFAEFALLEWGKRLNTRAVSFIVGLIALAAAVAAHSTLGAVFGFVGARPYYGGFFGPVYFILSAVLSGLAVMSFVTVAEYRVTGREFSDEMRELVTDYLGKSLAIVLAITAFFIVWKILVGLNSTSTATVEAYSYMLFGPPALWYWPLGIVAGLIIPFALLVHPKYRTPNTVLVAGALVLVGVFTTRYEYVIGGQVVALTNDPSHMYPLVSYTPSMIELTIVVLGFTTMALLYTVGRELFNLDEVPQHEHHSGTTSEGTADAEVTDDD